MKSKDRWFLGSTPFRNFSAVAVPAPGRLTMTQKVNIPYNALESGLEVEEP